MLSCLSIDYNLFEIFFDEIPIWDYVQNLPIKNFKGKSGVP